MYAWRAAVCATTIALVPLAMSLGAAQPGRSVFQMISVIGFLYSIFGGVLRTADAISEEKRENTLGLLFLTDLKPADVISGKLLASAANLFFGVLSLMPLLALPIIMGGVTSREIVLMALCFVNSLFFAVSSGFLISTVLRQGWVTISVALATM